MPDFFAIFAQNFTRMPPKVTVIVATYNQQATVGRAIESVLAQTTSFPIEILVGEDCSADATLQVCRRLESEHPGLVRVIANERNKGLVANYFGCVAQARGQYIADCAGDDFWTDPLKLQKQADMLDADPSIALCHTAWAEYDEESGALSAPIVPDVPPLTAKGELTERIVAHRQAPTVHLCTALYRADMARKAIAADPEGFSSPWLRCEDLQLIASLSAMGRVAFLPDCTLAYSVGHASASSAESEAKSFDFYLATARLTRHLQRKHAIADAAMAAYYRRITAYLFSLAFNLRDPQRRRQATALIGSLGAKPSAATRLQRALSASPAIWDAALALKKSLKSK